VCQSLQFFFLRGCFLPNQNAVVAKVKTEAQTSPPCGSDARVKVLDQTTESSDTIIICSVAAALMISDTIINPAFLFSMFSPIT
jgi:hypothetical protein